MDFFTKLAHTVNSQWAAMNYDEREFSRVAADALDQYPPHSYISLWDSVKWALTCDQLPHQTDMQAVFGQPPLTVYYDERFRIELLYWLTGITAIHQHAFSGAFHVLHGSSLHTCWHFNATKRLNSKLIIGDLIPVRPELLIKGDTRAIAAGDSLIHATFHLDRPSISVVIRTNTESNVLPQYQYLPPGIAFASQEPVTLIQRRLQVLGMLIESNLHSEYDDLIRISLDTADVLAVFFYLMQAATRIDDDAYCRTLYVSARKRHTVLMDVLEPALGQIRRGVKIQALRSQSADPHLRFFLALLLNVVDREVIIDLVARRYPTAEPIAMIVSWIKQLDLFGTPLNEAVQYVMSGAIRGLPVEGILSLLRDRFGEEHFDMDLTRIKELTDGLSAVPLFKPLFSAVSASSDKGIQRCDEVTCQGLGMERQIGLR